MLGDEVGLYILNRHTAAPTVHTILTGFYQVLRVNVVGATSSEDFLVCGSVHQNKG